MAEQNRRTPQQIKARQAAVRVVDCYLDVLMSSESGIPWEGRGLMGAMADFQGQIPHSSGYSGFCTLGNKVDRINRRQWTDEQVRACGVMERMSWRQRDALCIEQAYHGRTKVAIDPFTEKRREIHWTDEMCAQMMRVDVRTFRQRVSDGYARLESLIGARLNRAA